MSFGFSVGDFLAGAELAYTLLKALSETKGAAKEYRGLIAQLNVVHKVLMQVDQLRGANQLAQATFNALLFTVNATKAAMESFLDGKASYHNSLKAGGSGNPVKDIWIKGKWATKMPSHVSF
ncbi:Fc.00g055740.m01.CDS01 [Cosmosporella sp. VM-42]